MAEFPACAQNMVGNSTGACSLQLTGAAITVKFSSTNSSASWPYNCIRQFRADEDIKQFSFFSGRRGPYGVAEYKFDISEKVLVALQDALTQFTGAQFGQNQTTPSSNGTAAVFGGPVQDPIRTRRDPLPEPPGTPTMDTQPGYTTHRHGNFPHKYSTNDNFATLPPPRLRQESLSVRPAIPPPYSSQTIDSRVRRAQPSNNSRYTYHEVSGNFPPPPPGRVVPGPSLGTSGRKMSHGEDVFGGLKNMSPARAGKLMRQGTAPTQRFTQATEEVDFPTQSGVFSPPAAEPTDGESSDLDFGLLRRSSPQIDRKNTTRRGLNSPPENSPHHDVYNVPRSNPPTAPPAHFSNPPSPPTPSNTSSPHAAVSDALYQVPRSNSVDVLSQESADIPTSFPTSPTPEDNVYSVPKPTPGEELYNTPRPTIHREPSREEMLQDASGSIIYNVPSSKPAPFPQQTKYHHHQQQQQKMVRPPEYEQDLYNTPRPQVTAAEELYNSPRPQRAMSIQHTPSNTSLSSQPGGQEVYNVPRSILETDPQRDEDDDGLYKVPRSLEQPQLQQEELYNVPRTAPARSSYDSLQTVQNSPGYQINKSRVTSSSSPPHNTQQETYSVPRPTPHFSPVSERRADANGRRYPYDYVDHRIPRTPEGQPRLKPSRSLESLVRKRVTVSPDSVPSSFHSPGHMSHQQPTPLPRAQHRYIEIDVDDFREVSPSSPSSGSHGNIQENLYAEISDSETPERRSSHPDTGYSKVVKHDKVLNGGTLQYTSANNTPLPTQHGRVYSQNSNGTSKAARALHEEGYELVLPAEEAARNLTLKTQRMAANTQPMPIGRAQSISSLTQNTHYNYQNGGHPVIQGNNSTSQLGISVPHNDSQNDEYIIVNRRDFNLLPTQPRDIPVPLPQASTLSQSLNAGNTIRIEDEYEVMSSVKRGSTDSGRPNFTIGHSLKKQGVAPFSNGTPTPQLRTPLQSIRDSIDLDSVETGSRGSIGSGSHLDELVGPLSPIDAGAAPPIPQPYNGSIPIKRNVVRIASGSPHDVTNSKELKYRSNSVENILDGDLEKKKKYENVSGRDLVGRVILPGWSQQSLPIAGGQKKPPMPLPRPGRLEQ